MGLRGPTPTPNAILKSRGSKRAKTAADGIPDVPSGRPDKPATMTAEEGVVWEEMCGVLERIGVLTAADGRALHRYCSIFVRWRRAADFTEKNGDIYTLKDSKGEVRCVQPWPQSVSYNKLAVMLLKIEQEFGLTPAARTRVRTSATNGISSVKPQGKSRFFPSGPAIRSA
jgi:P27 family predicted phage terminase small subunit